MLNEKPLFKVLVKFEMLFDDIPSAISRSDSASANLAVNLSSVFSVLSLAEGDAPSKAARIAKMSSASEDEECLDPLERRGDTISLPGDSIPVIES